MFGLPEGFDLKKIQEQASKVKEEAQAAQQAQLEEMKKTNALLSEILTTLRISNTTSGA